MFYGETHPWPLDQPYLRPRFGFLLPSACPHPEIERGREVREGCRASERVEASVGEGRGNRFMS